MKKYLAILATVLAIALPSCAPKVVPIVPITPQAVRVKAATQASFVAAQRVERSVDTTKARADEANAKLTQAVARADKMAAALTVTKQELEDNAKAWRESQVFSQRVVDAAAAMKIDSHELTATTEATVKDSTEMETQAKTTDTNTKVMGDKIIKDAGKVAFIDGLGWWTKFIIISAVIIGLIILVLKFTVWGSKVAAKNLLIPLVIFGFIILPSCAPSESIAIHPKVIIVHPVAHGSSVLMVGDSLTCMRFGDCMETYLKAHYTQVHVMGSCGSSPEAWMDGHRSYRSLCGTKGFEGVTPHVENLIQKFQPDTIIVSLGTNHFDYLAAGGSTKYLDKTYEEFANKLKAKTVVWVCPPDSRKFSKAIQDKVEAAFLY